MKYLDYKIVFKSEHTVRIRIIRQKYRKEKFYPWPHSFVLSTQGICLRSSNHPAFCLKTLYCRGKTTTRDNRLIEIPQEVWSKVRMAIIEYNIIMSKNEKQERCNDKNKKNNG